MPPWPVYKSSHPLLGVQSSVHVNVRFPKDKQHLKLSHVSSTRPISLISPYTVKPPKNFLFIFYLSSYILRRNYRGYGDKIPMISAAWEAEAGRF